jgi:hypothetical protein
VSNIPNIDNNPSDSIKDYYDDPATAKKKEEITNEDEVSEPLDDEKPVEVKLEVPAVAASAVEPVVEEAEEEDIVIKIDEEDYQDERPGTLFSGWMRGRNR